jgi:hypothetical protein
LRIVGYGIYSEILDEFHSLLIIDNTLDDFSIDGVERVNLYKLAKRADDFLNDDDFGFVPIAGESL